MQEAYNFTVADDAVFFFLLVTSLGIGVYSALKTRNDNSTFEYLLGSKSMSPFVISFSLVGGVTSAIAILGNATEMYFYGTQLCMNMVGSIVGFLVVRNIFLSILYPLNILSMNEYIELRFKSRVLRKLATGCQLVSSFFHMGVCLYAPSITIAAVTGLPVWASVISIGSIFTFYITIGGVRAVVYTNVLQTILMFLGVLVVMIICCVQVGGVARVFEIASEGNRIELFNLNPSLYVRHTFWSTNLFGIYLIMSLVGVNQSQYLRFASVKSLKTAKMLCTIFPLGFYLLLFIFYLSGLVAYATYSDCDPLLSGRIDKVDMILPYLVADKLSHITGLAGFFVAAIYAGVLSTLSSQGNAIACIIWEDLLKHQTYFHHFNDQQATNVIKVLSAVTGVVAVSAGVLVGYLGTIFMVTYSIMSALKGPLVGLFLAGFCAPWVNRKGAAVGFVASFMTNCWLIIGKFMRGGGNPTTLPLSVAGCPENVQLYLNDTDIGTSSNATVALSPEMSAVAFPAKGESNTLYDMSYCYTGVLGIFLTVAISSMVSFITGPLPPKTVNERYLNKTCAKMYLKLWELSKGKKKFREEGEGEAAAISHELEEETMGTTDPSPTVEELQSVKLLTSEESTRDGAEDNNNPLGILSTVEESREANDANEANEAKEEEEEKEEEKEEEVILLNQLSRDTSDVKPEFSLTLRNVT